MNVSRPAQTFDFTRRGYQLILERALALEYTVGCFADFALPEAQPVLLLRHDLDHSIRAAIPIAELEAERSVRSTYFVQVTCDFYNLLGREGRAAIAYIATLGHEVGLHYDARRYAAAVQRGGIAAAERALRLDVGILEDVAAQPVISASQHLPSDTNAFEVLSVVSNEAYEERFTAGRMSYVSDSLMAWRQATPHDLLDRHASFQLLTHPMKWGAPVASMNAALQRAMQEECDELRKNYVEVASYYADLLRRREQLDAAFRARPRRTERAAK